MAGTQVKILVPGNHLMAGLLGQRDELLRLIEETFDGVRISVRGNEISIEGDGAERVAALFEELIILLESGQGLDAVQVNRTIDMMHDDVRPSEVLTAELLRSSRGRAVRPKTGGQKQYADAIASNIVTFGIGPAGTGKSYLAVALAVQALQARQVNRIILTRPAVEAGERLGFLPGDLMAKVDPYLRPLYDALHDLLEPEGAQRLIDRGAVEVAPLAFMRGRTLNNSFIILDEAQNTSPEQMKMFLTRIGFGSKAVITGDVTQIDVPGGRSGLVGLEPVLSGVPDLAFVHLNQRDVVRHRIVADIVAAYERVRARTATVTLDVYAADEQADHPVAVERWSRLARAVLEAEGIVVRHRGVPAVRGRGHHRLVERAVPRQAGPDRRAVLPHRGRGRPERPVAGRGRHRPRVHRARHRPPPPARRRGHLSGGGGPQRRRPRGDPGRRDRPCSWCTASSICWAWTTRSRPRRSGWSDASSSCWPATTAWRHDPARWGRSWPRPRSPPAT